MAKKTNRVFILGYLFNNVGFELFRGWTSTNRLRPKYFFACKQCIIFCVCLSVFHMRYVTKMRNIRKLPKSEFANLKLNSIFWILHTNAFATRTTAIPDNHLAYTFCSLSLKIPFTTFWIVSRAFSNTSAHRSKYFIAQTSNISYEITIIVKYECYFFIADAWNPSWTARKLFYLYVQNN